MSRAPFEKFIVMMLFFNKDAPSVVKKLSSFGYQVSEEEVLSIGKELRDTLPPSIQDIIFHDQLLNPDDPTHHQWLDHYGIHEYYDYTIRGKKNLQDPPPYFKWCEDGLWAHQYRDVMTIINIFLFNGEPLDSISDIVMFKFKRKVGIQALTIYKNVFWNCDSITAKEAFEYCIPFRNNSVIVKQIRDGLTQVKTPFQDDEVEDGSDVPFTFHSSEYLKWKIGYKNVKIPETKDFLESVKNDSYFKYYESMNMVQSVESESEDEEGSNEKLGSFDRHIVRKRRRNVEEQKAKMAKNWLELYIRADKSIPAGGETDAGEFFKRIQQLELNFGDEEKIATAESIPQLFEDIKGDM